MARYIDLDKLLKGLEDELKDKNPNDLAYLVFKLFIGRLSYEPTVNVVPNDDYQEAMREIETLKVLLEIQEKDYESLKELYDMDTEALIEARKKTETEVAREIFEEIERETKNHGITYSQRKIAELKKKYTEDLK